MTPRHLLGSSAIAALLAQASIAGAQTPDAAARATARQLGEEGMRALDKGDCATASEKLWRAHDLVHIPTLAFYAGQCLEKLGRLVDAEEKYLEAMRDPVEPNAPRAVKAAQADAEKARDALLPRIPSVFLSIRPQVPDAVLLVDGKPVPPAMIGVKRPIDPGTHDAAVQRGGAVVARRPFVVAEGQAVSVDIDVPAMPYGYPYPPRPGYGPYPQGPMAPMPPMPPMQRRNLGVFIAGVVLAPLGGITSLAGLIVSTDRDHATAGEALAVGGLIVMTGGIVMAVVGGKKVPIAPEAPPASAVSVEPLFGSTSGVRVRF